MARINLGDEVKDSVTGFKGVAVGRMIWLHGCERIIIQPKGTDKDGKVYENSTFDEPQVVVTKKAKVKEGNHRTGGPGQPFNGVKDTPSRR